MERCVCGVPYRLVSLCHYLPRRRGSSFDHGNLQRAATVEEGERLDLRNDEDGKWKRNEGFTANSSRVRNKNYEERNPRKLGNADRTEGTYIDQIQGCLLFFRR